MSLPLPVFQLELRSDLPYEPLCAIATGDAATPAAQEGGLLSRLQRWLASPRASLRQDGERG